MMARPTLIFSLGVLRLKAVQVAWASRPLDRALGHETVTTYEATTSGTAYGGHGNAADEWTDGARARPTILYSAAFRTIRLGATWSDLSRHQAT